MTQRSTTTTAESPATTATPKHNTHSQIWSHTFLQTYGTNLPTSLTYFLLFHQRLLTSETCCGLRYGLASLSTTSVTHAPQKAHKPPALLLPLFTSQSQPFFHHYHGNVTTASPPCYSPLPATAPIHSLSWHSLYVVLHFHHKSNKSESTNKSWIINKR